MTDKVLPQDLTVDFDEEAPEESQALEQPPVYDPLENGLTLDEVELHKIGLKFVAPDSNRPGYLALRKKVYTLFAEMTTFTTSTVTINAVIDFLVQFVVEPADKALACHILENNASKNQYFAMMGAVMRCEGDELLPFRSEEENDTGPGSGAKPKPSRSKP